MGEYMKPNIHILNIGFYLINDSKRQCFNIAPQPPQYVGIYLHFLLQF